MTRPTFLQGVGVALVASVAGSVLFAALPSILPVTWTLRLLIAGLAFGYLLFLLHGSPRRVGRATALALWLLSALALAWAGPPLPLYLAAHLGLIWLIRSVHYYAGGLPALADLGLSAFSLAAAAWAIHQSHSLFLAIWSLFLVQALSAVIPPKLGHRQPSPAGTAPPDRFHRASRGAEAALRKLATSR